MEHLPLFIRKLDQINENILNLYDENTSDKNKYVRFLQELQAVIYFDFGNVLFFRRDADTYGLVFFCQIGWPDEIERLYTTKYYKEDDVFPIFAKKTPVSMRSSCMFDDSRNMSSYYEAFMKTAGFDKSLECNIILSEEENCYGICSLFRNEPKHDFTTEEERVLEIIQQHLSNSAVVTGNKHSEFLQHRGGAHPFSGDIIFTREREILIVTDEFKKILHRHAPAYNLCNIVGKLIDNAKCAEAEDAPMRMFKLPDFPVFAEIREGRSETHGAYFSCRIYDTTGIVSNSLIHTVKQFDLSEKEAEILNLLLKGMNREEIARVLLYSVPTVKKYISSIYRKMSVKHHGQLISRLGVF
jgi:DNA-binding CsgD family transcriptional regulator